MLHLLCRQGDLVKIRILLSSACLVPAQINSLDLRGETAMFSALQPPLLFHPAAVLQELFARGADVNIVCGGKRRNLLHKACVQGDLTAVQLLLGMGAHVDLKV